MIVPIVHDHRDSVLVLLCPGLGRSHGPIGLGGGADDSTERHHPRATRPSRTRFARSLTPRNAIVRQLGIFCSITWLSTETEIGHSRMGGLWQDALATFREIDPNQFGGTRK